MSCLSSSLLLCEEEDDELFTRSSLSLDFPGHVTCFAKLIYCSRTFNYFAPAITTTYRRDLDNNSIITASETSLEK
jgi:hypothetical protein